MVAITVMHYKSLILLILSFGALRIAIAQPSASPPKEEAVKAIRKVFQSINQDHTLTVVSLTPEEIEDVIGASPDNGAGITGYYKKDTLRKMVVEVGPSYGLVRQEYYYQNGQPVFIYDTEKSFPATDSSIDHSRLVLNFEGRYYLNNGAIIDTKLKGKKRFEEEVNTAYIRKVIAYGRDYSNALYKHYKK